MKVKIENTYSDGHESTRVVELDPPDPAVYGMDDLDDWFDEVVFDHTGDGHGAGKKLGSHYEAEIVEAHGRPELVGLKHEWW